MASMAWTAAALAGSSGCAVHVVGMIDPAEEGPRLREIDGTSWKLSLRPGSRALAHLDGHTTEVWGSRVGRTVHVREWKVPEGLHGLPAWVGVLERQGVQIGMTDRNSGAFYFFDELATDTLLPFLGLPVLIEGYVEGAHRVKALYYRVLADQEADRENRGPGGME